MQNDIDAALVLKMSFDKGAKYDDKTINALLKSSELIHVLTANFVSKPLYAIWRIIALSEIPYTNRLEYTKQVVEYINKHLATQCGFTLTGKAADLLPCYNAMLVEAFSKLGYANTIHVQNAVTWIKRYQLFDRNLTTDWTGKGIQKYGGCLKATPCFIGIAKSVKALIYYDIAMDGKDKDIATLIARGMDYILQHNLYKRLTNQQPINNHITDLAFPASYLLNIVELLEMAYLTGNINHRGCKDALDYVMSKQTKEGSWKIDYIYKADGYVSFDNRGKRGQWLTYLIEKYIAG